MSKILPQNEQDKSNDSLYRFRIDCGDDVFLADVSVWKNNNLFFHEIAKIVITKNPRTIKILWSDKTENDCNYKTLKINNTYWCMYRKMVYDGSEFLIQCEGRVKIRISRP